MNIHGRVYQTQEEYKALHDFLERYLKGVPSNCSNSVRRSAPQFTSLNQTKKCVRSNPKCVKQSSKTSIRKNANTEVTIDEETNTSSVYLHGNLIATVTDNDMTIYDGGWQSNTTKSRLNALCDAFCITGEGVSSRKISSGMFANSSDLSTEKHLQERRF